MSQRTVWKQSMQRNKPLRDKSAWAWREETSAAIQSRWQHGYREGDERSKAVEEQEWCSERWVSSGWEMGVWTKLLLQMVWDMRAAEPKVTKGFWHEDQGGKAGWWSTATCFQNRYLCALLTAKLPPAFHNELRQSWPLSSHHLSFILQLWCLGSCKWIVSR